MAAWLISQGHEADLLHELAKSTPQRWPKSNDSGTFSALTIKKVQFILRMFHRQNFSKWLHGERRRQNSKPLTNITFSDLQFAPLMLYHIASYSVWWFINLRCPDPRGLKIGKKTYNKKKNGWGTGYCRFCLHPPLFFHSEIRGLQR